MDIPSIKFRYFAKLKLWHDYLSKDSVYEKEKKEYWKHEKMVLHWAYSKKHRHLYTALGNKRIFELYGIDKEEPKKILDNELRAINTEIIVDDVISDLRRDPGKVNYFMGNLVVEKLFNPVGESSKGFPERIRINEKGLLIGEILNEAYNKPSFWNKNFRKYRLGFQGLKILIIVAIVSLVFTLFNQAFEFIDKIYELVKKPPPTTL